MTHESDNQAAKRRLRRDAERGGQGTIVSYTDVGGDQRRWSGDDEAPYVKIAGGNNESFHRPSPLSAPADAKVTAFGALQVSEAEPVIELKSIYGISALRDVTTVAGSGAVTHSAAEYTVACTANGPDRAVLDSAKRVRYQPGTVGSAGVAIRTSSSLRGNQVQRWGAFTGDNGYFFGRDASGLFVGVRKNGVDTIVRQPSWNGIDRLDGGGEATDGLSLDLSKGHIFNIDYTWYGYGAVYFIVNVFLENGFMVPVTVHRAEPTADVSSENPNVPIRVELENDGTARAQDMQVAGRQFSVVGRFRPGVRQVQERVLNKSIGTSFEHVMSFRRKAGFAFASARLAGIELLVDNPAVWEVRFDPTLTNPSFGTPTNHSASETSLEVDTSATGFSGGELVAAGFGTSGSPSRPGLLSGELPPIDLVEQKPVTLIVQGLGASTPDISAMLKFEEEW